MSRLETFAFPILAGKAGFPLQIDRGGRALVANAAERDCQANLVDFRRGNERLTLRAGLACKDSCLLRHRGSSPLRGQWPDRSCLDEDCKCLH